MVLYKSSFLLIVVLTLLLMDSYMVGASRAPNKKEKDPRLKEGLETIFSFIKNRKSYLEIPGDDYVSIYFNPEWSNAVSDAVMDFYVAVARDMPEYTTKFLVELGTEKKDLIKSPSQILTHVFFALVKDELRIDPNRNRFTEEVFYRLEGVFSERQYSEFFVQMFIFQGAYETRPNDYEYSDCLAISGISNIDKISNFIESENSKALTLKSLIKELLEKNPLQNARLKTEKIDTNNNNNDKDNDDEDSDNVEQSLLHVFLVDYIIKTLPERSLFKSKPQAIFDHFGHLSFNDIDALFQTCTGFYFNESYLSMDKETMRIKLDPSPASTLLELANACEQLSPSSLFLRDYYNANVQKNYIHSTVNKRLSGHVENWEKSTKNSLVKLDCQSFDAFFKFCGEEDLKVWPIQFKPYLVRQIGDIAFDNYQYMKQLRRFRSLDDIVLLFSSEKDQLIRMIAERVRDVCDGRELEEYDALTLKAILFQMLDPVYSRLGYAMACYPSRFICNSGFSDLYFVIRALCVNDGGTKFIKVIQNSYPLEQRKIIGDYHFKTQKFLLREIIKRVGLMSAEEFAMAWARCELTKGFTISAIKYPIDTDLLFELFDEMTN